MENEVAKKVYTVTVPAPIGSGETKTYEFLTAETAINWAKSFTADVFNSRTFQLHVESFDFIPKENMTVTAKDNGDTLFACHGKAAYAETRDYDFDVVVSSKTITVGPKEKKAE